MPPTGATSTRTEDRGTTEVIGVVLLFGLVALGALALLLVSTSATNQIEDQNEKRVVVESVQKLDGKMGDLVARQGEATKTLDLSKSSVSTVAVEQGDKLILTANESSACQAKVDLDALRFESTADDGTEVIYQGGAVWKRTETGLTAVSWPDLNYDDRTLNVQVATAASSSFLAAPHDDVALEGKLSIKRLRTSGVRTREVEHNLLSGRECWRPRTLNVTVVSDEYVSLWEEHLRREMPDTADVTRSGDRVSVVLDREELSVKVNDSRNSVVNFTDNDSTNGVVYEGNDTVLVDKGTNKSYRASVHLLGAQVGDNETVYKTKTVPVFNNRTINTTNRSRRVKMGFVIDDSGSMCGGKLSDAQSAAKAGVGEMNASMNDTVAAVGFDGDAHAVRAPPTDDYSSVKSAIDGLSCGGGTNIGNGIELTHNKMGSAGPNTSGAMVVLTDGRGCGDCRRQAKIAAAKGLKVYTIGVGSNVNTGLLQDLASIGGGNYHHVSSASDLTPVFKSIINDTRHTKINQTVNWTNKTVLVGREIRHQPVELDLAVGGSPVDPWTGGGSVLSSQLNYPASPDRDEGMHVGDGQKVVVERATVHDCTSWSWTGEVESPPSNPSQVYKHMKCTGVGGVLKQNSSAQLYVDGDSVPSDDPIWWQDNTSGLVSEHATDTDGDGEPDEFDLASNEVAVVVPLNDTGEVDANNVVFVARIGTADSDARSQWLVNVQIANVELEDES